MEARSMKVTQMATHLLLATSIAGLMFVGWELSESIKQKDQLVETQSKARSRIEQLKEKNPFVAIDKSLSKVQTTEALDRLSKLDQNISQLEKQLDIKRSEEITNIFIKFKNAIQDSKNLSRPDELLSTISDKVDHLIGLAKTRKWQNIARISSRIESRLVQLRSSQKVESPLVKYMESDLLGLTQLVKTSTLDESDKGSLLNQLEGIRQELSMLLDLHQSRRGSGEHLQNAQEALGHWIAKAELAIGTLDFRAQSKVDTSINHFWILTSFLFVGWILVGMLWTMARRSQKHLNDQNIIELLTLSVLGESPSWKKFVGSSRIDEVSRTLNVIKKRMSLGENFQEAMPFGSLLVDDKSNLIWGNELFCEQFSIEAQDLEDEFINWTQIKSRISGVDIDPIEFAISEMQPGTWQIQLQMEDGVSIPLEMHVTPIEHKASRKVLVIFYPLAMMKETIQTQARIIMEPVRLALDALEKEDWGLEVEERLAPQWRQVGLGEDWEKLSRSIYRMNQARNDLFNHMTQIENENHDYLKTIKDLSVGVEERISGLKNQMSSLKEMRDCLVSIDQLNNDLVLEHSSLVTEARTFVKKHDYLVEASRSLGERLTQAKEAASAIEKCKQEYKEGKLEIQLTKQLMVTLHNKFLNTIPDMSEKAEVIASEMKEALMRLDRATQSLETRLSSLDIQITKLAMNFAGPIPDIEKVTGALDLNVHERVAREIQVAIQEDQDLVIQHLKKIVDDLKQDSQAMGDLIKSTHEISVDPSSASIG
ncbi:MAG: hypothetical protein K2P81_14065 [Bacteriovoracaceae bacterium]|nr:hypothetical protein [Bacteriovoracaceae bacterium]